MKIKSKKYGKVKIIKCYNFFIISIASCKIFMKMIIFKVI